MLTGSLGVLSRFKSLLKPSTVGILFGEHGLEKRCAIHKFTVGAWIGFTVWFNNDLCRCLCCQWCMLLILRKPFFVTDNFLQMVDQKSPFVQITARSRVGGGSPPFYLKGDFCHDFMFFMFSCASDFQSFSLYSISTLHEREGPGCHRHFEPSGVAAGPSAHAAPERSRALLLPYWLQCCSVFHFLAAVGLVHVDQFRPVFHLRSSR